MRSRTFRREEGRAWNCCPRTSPISYPRYTAKRRRAPRPSPSSSFFSPWSSWTWYASEYDPEERLFFGVVIGHEREAGYFSLDELRQVRGPGGLQIERDLFWTPKPLKDCF